MNKYNFIFFTVKDTLKLRKIILIINENVMGNPFLYVRKESKS